MPYIKQEKRQELRDALDWLSEQIKCEGDLNYVITSLCHDRLFANDLNYQNVNNLIGALECAKLELYRVIAGPYEDIKMKENGSVSLLDAQG